MNEKPCIDINQISKETKVDNALTTNFDEIENYTERQKLGQKNERIREEQGKQAESYKTLLNDEIMSPESTPLQLDDEIDSETVNPESASRQLYNTKEKVDGEKENEIRHVEKLILKNDYEGVLKYLGLDKNIINKIGKIKIRDIIGKDLLAKLGSINPPKNILNDDLDNENSFSFLEGETDIIAETQSEYNKLHRKLIKINDGKEDSKDLIFPKSIRILFIKLKVLSMLNQYKNKKLNTITNEILDLKDLLDKKRRKIARYIKKYHEYEKGEYVNFPNGINFQLLQGPETISGKDIKIGDDEFYIHTQINVRGEDKKTLYSEYVDSLVKARKLFEKKYGKIKYCKRFTWLANREFIEEYEKERKKRKEKEGIKYEESNRLKVLKQTENAVISYRLEKNGESPIRFINKNKDKHLFEFAKKNDNFCEAEMWLDIDKLEHQQL